jgi:hypothetical protein
MGMNLLINCDEATTICDKSQYNEASFMEKVRLSLHLALCKNCKKYTKQNNLMSDVFNRFATPCQGSDHMPDKDKSDLEAKLKQELEKH